MDDRGAGKTSDVIAAAEWIYQNKAAYNIRVANFSLHSGAVNHFWLDPLNVAVEKLWHSGVVVVAAAGNYGVAGGASGVRYAPGSDPFVITVGAVDIGGTARPRDDDSRAVVGLRTHSGRLLEAGDLRTRPVHGRPGPDGLDARGGEGGQDGRARLHRALRHVVRGAGDLGDRGPDPRPEPELDAGSGQERADAAGPRRCLRRTQGSCGVGQVNAVQSVLATTETPNPNTGAEQVPDARRPTGRPCSTRSPGRTCSWSDVSWDAVSWSDVSWSDVSWDAVSWSDVSWTDVSWSDVSWSDVSWEDDADGEMILDGDGYELTPAEAEAAAEDVDLLTPDEKLRWQPRRRAAGRQLLRQRRPTAAAAAAGEPTRRRTRRRKSLPPAAPTLP